MNDQIGSIGFDGTGKTSQPTNIAQNNKTKSSIFTDKNNNGIVDKDDFDNTSIGLIVEKNDWIGKSWDECSNKINNLFQNLSIAKSADSVEKVFTQIVKNLDPTNHSEVVAVLTALTKAKSPLNGTPLLTEKQSEKLKNQLYDKLNVDKDSIERYGNDLSYTLESGSVIYQQLSVPYDNPTYGQVTWHNPDGTTEFYTPDGKRIEK